MKTFCGNFSICIKKSLPAIYQKSCFDNYFSGKNEQKNFVAFCKSDSILRKKKKL